MNIIYRQRFLYIRNWRPFSLKLKRIFHEYRRIAVVDCYPIANTIAWVHICKHLYIKLSNINKHTFPVNIVVQVSAIVVRFLNIRTYPMVERWDMVFCPLWIIRIVERRMTNWKLYLMKCHAHRLTHRICLCIRVVWVIRLPSIWSVICHLLLYTVPYPCTT